MCRFLSVLLAEGRSAVAGFSDTCDGGGARGHKAAITPQIILSRCQRLVIADLAWYGAVNAIGRRVLGCRLQKGPSSPISAFASTERCSWKVRSLVVLFGNSFRGFQPFGGEGGCYQERYHFN